MSQIENNSQFEEENNDDEYKNQQEANKVRKEYRSIREDITENRLNFVDPNSDAIEKALENVENTFKKVKKPREAVSDSHILLELAILGKERIKNVHCVFRSFNNNEFMDKLKLYMASSDKKRKIIEKMEPLDEEELDEEENGDEPRTSKRAARKSSNFYVLTKPVLENFGKKCMNYFNVLPRPSFLLGSLNKEVLFTQRKVRQKRVVEKNLDEVKTKIKELDVNSAENDENSTITEIERIFELLKKYFKRMKGSPICFYTFIINPFSFSRTIENIFYVSFLVKDGYAKIYLDADGLPVIEPVVDSGQDSYNPAEADKKRKEKSINHIQSMVSLTKTQWKELIEVFSITTALIKDPKNKS